MKKIEQEDEDDRVKNINEFDFFDKNKNLHGSGDHKNHRYLIN